MWDDNEAAEDLLGYTRYAAAVASIIRQPSLLPITVGIFGDWGSGKSSVLRLTEKRLNDEPSILCLRFDGWLFEGYEDAKAALMQETLRAIEEYVKSNASIGDKAKTLIGTLCKRVDWFRVAGLATKGIVSMTTPFGIAGFAASLLSSSKDFLENPEQVSESLRSAFSKDSREIHENIRAFRDEFEELIAVAQLRPLVILIDDLDRCLPRAIVSTLEAIKLFLSVPNTAFVIAADERVVKGAVSHIYKTEYAGEDLSEEYLDKLVQVPIYLPPLNATEVEDYLNLLYLQYRFGNKSEQFQIASQIYRDKPTREPVTIDKLRNKLPLTAEIEEDFARVARIAAVLSYRDPVRGNPRYIKRFINSLSLRLALATGMGISLNESILCKLMILERFRSRSFQELHGWQASQGGVAEELRRLEKSAETDVDEPDLDKSSKIWLEDDELKEWLRSDPKLSGLPLGEYFSLARESAGFKTAGIRQLPLELQKICAQLQSPAQTERKVAADALCKRADGDIQQVLSIIVDKARKSGGQDLLDGLFLCAMLSQVAALIVLEAIKKYPSLGMDKNSILRLKRLAVDKPACEKQIGELFDLFAKTGGDKVARYIELANKPALEVVKKISPKPGGL